MTRSVAVHALAPAPRPVPRSCGGIRTAHRPGRGRRDPPRRGRECPGGRCPAACSSPARRASARAGSSARRSTGLDDALVVTGHGADMATGEIPFGVLADTLRDLVHRSGPDALTAGRARGPGPAAARVGPAGARRAGAGPLGVRRPAPAPVHRAAARLGGRGPALGRRAPPATWSTSRCGRFAAGWSWWRPCARTTRSAPRPTRPPSRRTSPGWRGFPGRPCCASGPADPRRGARPAPRPGRGDPAAGRRRRGSSSSATACRSWWRSWSRPAAGPRSRRRRASPPVDSPGSPRRRDDSSRRPPSARDTCGIGLLEQVVDATPDELDARPRRGGARRHPHHRPRDGRGGVPPRPAPRGRRPRAGTGSTAVVAPTVGRGAGGQPRRPGRGPGRARDRRALAPGRRRTPSARRAPWRRSRRRRASPTATRRSVLWTRIMQGFGAPRRRGAPSPGSTLREALAQRARLRPVAHLADPRASDFSTPCRVDLLRPATSGRSEVMVTLRQRQGRGQRGSPRGTGRRSRATRSRGPRRTCICTS